MSKTFIVKNAEIRGVENFPFSLEKNTGTFCQTLDEVPWLLRLERPKNRQKFSENLKKCKFYQKN